MFAWLRTQFVCMFDRWIYVRPPKHEDLVRILRLLHSSADWDALDAAAPRGEAGSFRAELVLFDNGMWFVDDGPASEQCFMRGRHREGSKVVLVACEDIFESHGPVEFWASAETLMHPVDCYLKNKPTTKG